MSCRLQEAAVHRLCPDYATDINSPLRHVRTRIYFTSESHVHSLINVLRFCHLGAPPLPFCPPVSFLGVILILFSWVPTV